MATIRKRNNKYQVQVRIQGLARSATLISLQHARQCCVSQGLMDLLDSSNELKIFKWQTIIISFRLIDKSPIIIFILSIRKNLKGK